jgi:MtN3 and saliva related transmembrane protein
MIFGWLASIITVAASFPQAAKTYRTKKTEDLSLLMWVLYSSASFCWALYAYSKKDMILLSANIVTFFVNSYVLCMKLKYK